MQQHDPRSTSADIKRRANLLGFDACGIASTETPVDSKGQLSAWLEAGRHGSMGWMARTTGVREDPRRKLPGAKSVVVVARNYYADRPDPTPNSGRIARYAWGRDYHKVLKKPLIELARFIESLQPGVETYASVDTGPVLERAWAQRAGVGAIGKNTMAIRRDMGSWFFLATVLTTLELEADEPATDVCGTCTACIDACPTQAIIEPFVLDSNRCISYQTIENRDEIPEALREQHGDWVFGCDVCQEVCPWNRFATATTEVDFLPREGHANPQIDTILAMNEPEFDREFAGTPIRRTKHAGMQRNAAIARDNITGAPAAP